MFSHLPVLSRVVNLKLTLIKILDFSAASAWLVIIGEVSYGPLVLLFSLNELVNLIWCIGLYIEFILVPDFFFHLESACWRAVGASIRLSFNSALIFMLKISFSIGNKAYFGKIFFRKFSIMDVTLEVVYTAL